MTVKAVIRRTTRADFGLRARRASQPDAGPKTSPDALRTRGKPAPTPPPIGNRYAGGELAENTPAAIDSAVSRETARADRRLLLYRSTNARMKLT